MEQDFDEKKQLEMKEDVVMEPVDVSDDSSEVEEYGGVSWQAKEYIVENREVGWYMAVILIVIGLCAMAAYFRYWSFMILVLVSVMALFVYVKRPAKVIDYRINNIGLWEANRLHRYKDFKAFSVVQEQNNFSVVLVPKKRFGLPVRVFFPQEQGEKIVDMLGVKLPMEEYKMDFLDKIVKFLRI